MTSFLTTPRTPRSPSPGRVLTAGAITGAVLVLTACGGPSAGSTTAPATASTSATGAGPGAAGAGGQGQRPGASGLIAAVEGRTLQVQSPTDQTAVTYTSATRITRQVTVSASSVKVGDCVMARPSRPAGAAAGSPGAPTGAAAAPTTLAAATVSIVSSTGKGCTALAVGGSSGQRPPGAGRAPNGPGGPAATRPPGGGFGRGGGAFGTVGEVTALGSGTFTIAPSAFRRGNQATATATASSSPSPSPVTVTYTPSTTFSATRPGTSKDVAVAKCVRAFGAADQTGAITATSLALSAPVDGSCATSGFGGFGG